MVAHRPDWCISRQRVWGVPIVAFYCASVRGAAPRRARWSSTWPGSSAKARGADVWYTRAAADAAARRARAARSAAAGSSARRPTSSTSGSIPGCSHAAVLETRPGAALARRHLPRGLGPAPRLVPLLAARRGGHARTARRTERCSPTASWWTARGARCPSRWATSSRPRRSSTKYGAEILRLWVAAEDYSEDIRLSHEILNRLADAYRRIRNTFRFLLGNLADFDPERDRRAVRRRWTSSTAGPCLRLGELIARVRAGLRGVRVPRRLPRRRTTSAPWTSRRSTSTSSRTASTSRRPTTRAGARRRPSASRCSTALARLLAPVLTFTADEVWALHPRARQAGERPPRHLPRGARASGSTSGSAREWERLLEVRGEVSRALEAARKQGLIGKGIDAVVYVTSAPEEQWRPAARRQGRSAARDALQRLGRAARQRGARRAPGSPTRARTFRGSLSPSCPRRPSAGRSASAAGPGARAWARTPGTPRSAIAACRWCVARS